MKRKLISLFLGAVMVLGSVAMLASCAEGNKKTTTGNNSGVNPDEHFLAKIPADLNFANMGYDEDQLILNVAYTEGNNGEFTRRSLKADELDESDVDIATMARDTRMKEQLGLELEIEPQGGILDLETNIGTTLQSGTPDWDILAAYQFYGIKMARNGYLLNLAELNAEDIQADYIDLSAPYWGQAFNDNMSYKGAYYWITGDIALRYIGGMYCTYVNSRLYNDMLSGEYGSIYDIAKEGKWTMDLLTTMASMCYVDNGTTPGEVDTEDTFGFGWEPGTEIPDGIALGAGVQFTFKDPDTGDVIVSIMNQRTFDFSVKLKALANTSDFTGKYAYGDGGTVMTAFASGTVAFTVQKLFQAETYLADMIDDYYIIPVPKFDETQESYITGIHDGCTIFGIPYCSEKVPQAAAALEFLCAYSSKDVAPLYYEGALKGRYTRDKEAATMIDMIHDSVTTDFAVAWGDSIANLPHLFRDCEVITQNTIKRRVLEWENALRLLTEDLAEYIHGGATPE